MLASFTTGFAAGWLVRSGVESSRAVVVKVIAAGFSVVGGLKRAVAIEREYFEDLLAEARAQCDAAMASRRTTETEGDVRPDASNENGSASHGADYERV